MGKSPFAPAGVASLACAAALVRWGLQGSNNLYTALAKRFYVPDPDLGWRVSEDHPIWLGLEVCAVLAAIALGLVVVAFVIRARVATSARVIAWVVGVAPLGVAIVAFASGGRPAGARDLLPATAAVLVDTGFAGSLDARAGTYTIVAHTGTAITAHLKAGGETFDARFDHDITGEWQGDPHDPSRPMHAHVRAAAAAVDTGVRARTKHAREKYLRTDEYPALELSIDRVLATRADRPDVLAFRAAATVHLMDRSHPVEIAGKLERPDAAGLARLGLAGDVLVVQADFALPLSATALAPKAGDFDGDRIPIHASLVLRRDRD